MMKNRGTVVTINPEDLRNAAALLERSSRPLLISHPRPDGDTIGSTLALRLTLLELGKSPIIACEHPLGDNLAYLPGAKYFVDDVDEGVDIDLVVAVDMSDLSRTGTIYKDSWRNTLPLLVIDHHTTNRAFGDVNLVDPSAAATAVLLVDLITSLGVEVKDDIATCLLVALLTDTRGLRTQSTTPAVLRLVSELIEAGGNYIGVMQRTLDSVPYLQMRAWGMALDRLKLDKGFAWTTFPVAVKDQLNIDDFYDLDLGNLLSRVAEANIIAAFIEMRDNTVKVSMRARPGFDVARIAMEMGGGGHMLAAGFTMTGPIDNVVAQVVPKLQNETTH
ncbi:MAG: DHHA1 domain-containing protein [Anaerolineae bacterium]|nr:DHHA1 domain-containing protein [Anaerolineae bacterium]